MSQPAVTRALQQVEELLHVQLFERRPNGVVATIFVEPILKRAKTLHLAMREAERELQLLKSPDLKRMTIGTGILSRNMWVNPAIASMMLGDRDLTLTTQRYDWNELIRSVRDGLIDYGVGEIGDVYDDRELNVEPLAELELHFVCSADHPLARLPHPKLADIRQYPMVGNKVAGHLTEQFGLKTGALGHIDQASGSLYPAIPVASLHAIKIALAQSEAVAIMPVASARKEIEAGSLIALDRSDMPWLIGKIGLISLRSRRPTRLMQKFRKTIYEIELKRREKAPWPVVADRMKSAKRLKGNDESHLAVGGGAHSIEIFGNPAVAQLLLAEPDLRISVSQYAPPDLAEQIRCNAIDIGVSEIGLIAHHHDLEIEPIAEMPVYFVCRADHPLTRQHNISLQDVFRYPAIGNRITHVIAQHFPAELDRFGRIEPESGTLIPSIRLPTVSAIKHGVMSSDAIALMPRETIISEISSGRLALLDRKIAPNLSVEFGLVSRKGHADTDMMMSFRRTVIGLVRKNRADLIN